MLVDIARENAHVSNELNVLVVGMPNVGKSTLLNALRNMGIPGRTYFISRRTARLFIPLPYALTSRDSSDP